MQYFRTISLPVLLFLLCVELCVDLCVEMNSGNLIWASDFQSPRTAGLGGAGHASPLLSDAIYLNPSFTSFMNAHALSFNYVSYGNGMDRSPTTPEFYGHEINLSILDGMPTSLFQAGLGYTRREDLSFLHIGASKSFFERLGVGIGGKFIFPNDGGDRKYEATFSTTGLISSWFQSAFIIDNLIESAVSAGFYREYILGTKFNVMSMLLIYVDPHWVPTLPDGQTQWGYEAGAEIPFFTNFFLRMGLFRASTITYEAQRGDGYGLGLGWLAPRLSLDYSFSRAFRPIAAIAHTVGFTIYF